MSHSRRAHASETTLPPSPTHNYGQGAQRTTLHVVNLAFAASSSRKKSLPGFGGQLATCRSAPWTAATVSSAIFEPPTTKLLKTANFSQNGSRSDCERVQGKAMASDDAIGAAGGARIVAGTAGLTYRGADGAIVHCADFYNVLRMSNAATGHEINQAFRRLMKEAQQQQLTGTDADHLEATEKIALLNAARNALKPDVRDKYDRQLAEGGSGAVLDMDEVARGIWLGALSAAAQTTMLRARGIEVVLTVASGLRLELPDDFEHRQISMRDESEEDLLAHLGPALSIIRDARVAGKQILVHCYAGVSRSAAVVIAHLMTEARGRGDAPSWLAAAYRIVRSARPAVEPNPGFMRQLMAFEALGCPEVLPLKTEYQPMVDEADVASLEINWNEKCAAASRVARGAEEANAAVM